MKKLFKSTDSQTFVFEDEQIRSVNFQPVMES
jgi:hypothetical protein